MPVTKSINLALQGGGAHGAFTWGVLDRLLSDERIHIEAISGTSAGSMNAVVLAEGMVEGGRERAREQLKAFWKSVHLAGKSFNPMQRMPWEHVLTGVRGTTVAFEAFNLLTRFLSPYQLNPMRFNPLRTVLEKHVNFERLHDCGRIRLFLTATNIRTGKPRIFTTEEVTADVVMASACLPSLFQAVEIDGEYYWDGGFLGNPALFPLIYESGSRDIVIVHINPIERPAPPIRPSEIENRVNEITFNSSLLAELRAIAFVQKLHDQNMLKEEHRDRLRYMLVHSMRADVALSDLSFASKYEHDWGFLKMLRNRGRSIAREWLEQTWADLGERQTVNLQHDLLYNPTGMGRAKAIRR